MPSLRNPSAVVVSGTKGSGSSKNANAPKSKSHQPGVSRPSQSSSHKNEATPTFRNFRQILRSASRTKNQIPNSLDDELHEYLTDKTDRIVELKMLCDIELTKEAELARRTSIFRRQAVITKGIIEKEQEAWNCAGAGSSALLGHELTEVMSKEKAIGKLLDTIKANSAIFIAMIVHDGGREELPAVTEMKRDLVTKTETKLTGSTDLAVLVEDAIAAKTNFSAVGEDTYISVGNGRYNPLMVLALVRVGVLRFHAEDHGRVTLACELGKY